MLKAVHPLPLSPHQKQLTKQAQKLVGQTFYGTLLKQMHNSPFKSKIMDGGRGGEAFSPLMDQHLIDHMSTGKNAQKLVKSIVKHLERRETAQKNSTAPVPAEDKALREIPIENVRMHVAPGLRA